MKDRALPRRVVRTGLWSLAGALLVLQPPTVAAAGTAGGYQLTPQSRRITDQAIAHDRAVFAAWAQRLERARPTAGEAHPYDFAKAAAWLELAAGEYAADDRTGVVDAALAQVAAIALALETDAPGPGFATPIPAGSSRVRPELWRLADSLKSSPGFRCAAPKLAALEVQLVRAGNEALLCRPGDPHPQALAAESLAVEVSVLAEGCVPPLPTIALPDTAPRPALIAAPPPPRLVVDDTVAAVPMAESEWFDDRPPFAPDRVHFALDRWNISAASASVLDTIALVLRDLPLAKLRLYGHTDRRGSRAYNLALSRRRAVAVRDYLVRAGIDRSRISLVSEGKAQVLNTGGGAMDHALNRRVVVQYFTPEGVQLRTFDVRHDLQIEQERTPRERGRRERRKP